MFPVAHPSQRPSKESEIDGSTSPATPPVLKTQEIKESQCFLKSVRDLRTAVMKAKHTRQCHLLAVHLPSITASSHATHNTTRSTLAKPCPAFPAELGEILAKHTFVGVVDATRCLSLVQHNTRLYLLNHGALAAELFYQLGLRQFGNFSRIRLHPAPELRTLVALAVDAEEDVEESGLSKHDVVEVGRSTLVVVLERTLSVFAV